MTQARRRLGDEGESAAARWYADQGYEVVARNWRCRAGELDLVVRKGPVLVFCEVKTRSSAEYGHPAEAVTHDKRQRIRHLAARYLDDASPRPAQIRFDIVAVLAGEVEVYEGAF